MAPRYTIITPTLVRPTLVKMCESLDAQTCQDWEHIIGLDVDAPSMDILNLVKQDPRRTIVPKSGPGGYWGSLVRRRLHCQATGEYILYTDDDVWYTDEHSLAALDKVTAKWAIWPLLYKHRISPIHPIKAKRSDNNQIAVHRSCPAYLPLRKHETDGIYIEMLHKFYVPDEINKPLVVYP